MGIARTHNLRWLSSEDVAVSERPAGTATEVPDSCGHLQLSLQAPLVSAADADLCADVFSDHEVSTSAILSNSHFEKSMLGQVA